MNKSSIVLIAVITWLSVNLLFISNHVKGQTKLEDLSQHAIYSVVSSAIKIGLTGNGEITGRFEAATRLAGCREKGAVIVKRLSGGGYFFTHHLIDAQNNECTLTDKYTPTKNSIRWEVEIMSKNKPWSTAIETHVNYPATKASRFWTTWGHPDNEKAVKGAWVDPLENRPFADRSWFYQFEGLPDADKAQKCFSIPLFTIAEQESDEAFSFVQSPEDVLLDLTLKETETGKICLSRSAYRLGEGKTVHFAMDIISHPADMRAGLGWMVNRYPQFFNPINPVADTMVGCAAYSGSEDQFDVERMRQMSFRVNWKCSEDFPYMGMFLPPVKDAQTRWERAKDEITPGKPTWTSFQTLNDYSHWMKNNGFYVLSYFNVTEFGRYIKYPAPARVSTNDSDLWKDPNDFLYYGNIASSLLMKNNKPIPTYCGGLVVDPGNPVYQQFLLEQAKRHIEKIPDSYGICIDRTDWLGCNNPNADDGVSWINGKPARSLFMSWKSLMDKLGPLMHKAGKVIFVNNCTVRLETLRQADGIYAEWTGEGSENYFNYSALEGVRKPVMTWTPNENALRKDGPDFYMQRCLYLGVYPTAPYPHNNHCLLPSGYTDEIYLAYGKLLDAIRGKKWVLKAHCIKTATAGVKANLFETEGGYAIPVVFGGNIQFATVRIQEVSGIEKMKFEVLHPGMKVAAKMNRTLKNGVLEFNVPLKNGCAMVLLKR